MAGSILDWPKFIKTVYESVLLYCLSIFLLLFRYYRFSRSELTQDLYSNTSSGGWAEFQDYNGQYQCDDGSLTEKHYTRKWINGLIEAGRKLGRDPMPGPQLEGWVREAGFKNVVHRKIKMPIGPWPRDPQLKLIGLLNITQVLDGLEGFSLRLFCDVLQWSEQDVGTMLAQVREELTSGKLHCYVDFHVVYGHKEH